MSLKFHGHTFSQLQTSRRDARGHVTSSLKNYETEKESDSKRHRSANFCQNVLSLHPPRSEVPGSRLTIFNHPRETQRVCPKPTQQHTLTSNTFCWPQLESPRQRNVVLAAFLLPKDSTHRRRNSRDT